MLSCNERHRKFYTHRATRAGGAQKMPSSLFCDVVSSQKQPERLLQNLAYHGYRGLPYTHCTSSSKKASSDRPSSFRSFIASSAATTEKLRSTLVTVARSSAGRIALVYSQTIDARMLARESDLDLLWSPRLLSFLSSDLSRQRITHSISGTHHPVHCSARSQQMGKWQTDLAAASCAALLTKLSSRTEPRKSSSFIVRWSVWKSMSSGVECSFTAAEAWSNLPAIASRIVPNMVAWEV